MRRAVVLISLCGCGFQVGAAAQDAHGSDAVADGTSDAVADGAIDGGPTATCMARWMNQTVQLTTPMRIVELSSADDDRDPYLSGDERRLYFASERNNSPDLWVASRTTKTGPFTVVGLAADLYSVSSDSKMSLTTDELTVVLASDRSGSSGGSVDLWLAMRTSTQLPFTGFTRTPFGTANDNGYQLDPEINGDGLRVYFAYGSGPQRLVVISRGTAIDPFGSMTELINSGLGDSDPSVSTDERLILFSSNRGGGLGAGDIWYTTRASATATTFTTTQLVPTVNTSSSDGDPTLSRDGCTLYFASNRTGNYEIYVSTVVP